MSETSASPGVSGGSSVVQEAIVAQPPESNLPSWPLIDQEDPAEKFELLLQLGRGSYGSVYQARVKDSDETVAIKVIPVGEQDDIAEIQKEIDMLKECNHPNVVRYLGSWRTKGALWIAMEFCGGGSVSDLVQAAEGPLEEDIISYICAETLAGLNYLHAIGKVHRDIKCGNILLTEAGEVKLADFGVAAQLTRTMSKRNTFIGTPHWMAPEVIQESRYDGKVDVWALGISAIEMAEVTPPRWAVHPMRVIFMISREPPPQLADKDAWSPAFQSFVSATLRKDPVSRPAAKDLQQHEFVQRPHSNAAQALQPLIERSRILAAELFAESDGPPKLPPGVSVQPGNVTGHFSWRQPAGLATGTILASPPDQKGAGAPGARKRSPAPAGGQWPKSGVQRAPLEGLYGNGSRAAHAELPNGVSSSDAYTNASGTMIINPGDTVGASGSAMDTMIVAENGNEQSSDYLAALRAASANDYRRGLEEAQRAARTRQEDDALREQEATAPPFAEEETPPHASSHAPSLRVDTTPTPLDGRAPLADKLRNLFESGAVPSLPFLRAADACPMALLDDVRAPYRQSRGTCLATGYSMQQAPTEDDLSAALASLMVQPPSRGSPPSTTPPSTFNSSATPPSTIRSGVTASPFPPSDITAVVPPQVVARVKSSQMLSNLLRTLAHQRRVAATSIMSPAEARQQQQTIVNTQDALRCLLNIA
ncbi:probable serine/threonine-protein kinase 4 at N-terminal half [Coccomyxa sp. Obi]|nr:probable serine/threonine-protein kinase 4 at N-terminal half [Coccomyxa sp. Obi]